MELINLMWNWQNGIDVVVSGGSIGNINFQNVDIPYI